MKKYLFLLIPFCITCNSNQEEAFVVQVGDFLFQDLDSSPLCDAIELVTPGYKEGNFSHIGIVTDQYSSDEKRPLIMHNIGMGQVLEDMLFDYQITGHYRYGVD